MRRHPSLRDLSVDHHHALVHAHRLQRAASVGETECARLVSEFLQFWEADGQRHFCEEEQILLPFFARYGDLKQEPIERMLREHALIRRDVLRLTVDQGVCHELGKQLEAHVRLEEREVFPLIESVLPIEAFPELEEKLLAYHGAANSAQWGATDSPEKDDRNMNEKYLLHEDLATAIVISPESIVSRTLRADENHRSILFGFDTGQELSEHTAAVPAIIHIISGEADLTLGGESQVARAGTWAYMPAHLPHSIVARTPVVMLLTMFKKSAESTGSDG